MTATRIDWSGVFPAATTQFKPDLSIDYEATQRVQDALIKDGVNGLIIMGSPPPSKPPEAAYP
jgi:1-pyrroline-4-hydroxy-2-carboxylate deaminase